MTGGPGKEHITKKPLLTRRVWERSKGDATCPTTSQNPSCWHLSELSNACTTRKDPESELLAKDTPETNPITIKPKTASHIAEQFSWIPLPYCSCRVDSLEKTDAGRDWGQEEKGMTDGWMASPTRGHEFEWTLEGGDGQGGWCAAIHGVAKSQTWLSNWTEHLSYSNSSRNCRGR